MNPFAPRDVNDVAGVVTMKHECISSRAFGIPQVALLNVNEVSYVPRIVPGPNNCPPSFRGRRNIW